MSFFWVGHFEFFFRKKKIFFCFIPMKISPNLYGRMNGSKFWCFPWFPENSLLCVILRYTVYIHNTVTFLFFWLCKYLISFKASLGSQFANLLARSESWQGHCYYVHKCIRSTSSKNRAGDRVRDKKKSCWRLFSSRPDGMSKAGYFFESARIKKSMYRVVQKWLLNKNTGWN